MKSVTPDAATKARLSVFAALIALSGQAIYAQESTWYGGISGGEGRADVEDETIITALRTKGFSTQELSVDDKDMAAKIFGGFSLNRYFAVEASYFDLGNVEFQASVTPSGVQHGDASINGFSLDLVGTMPLAEDYSAFARAGVNNARIKQNFRTSPGGALFANSSDRGTNENYGIGVEFALTNTITVRAEMEHYRIDETLVASDRINTYMIGFVYRLDERRR